MGANKRQASTESPRASPLSALSAVARIPSAVILSAVFFVVVVAIVVVGWRQFGRNVVARPIYRIAAESIETTPPPAWIRTDVRAEIVQDGALNDLTIFDRDASIRVYQAFELHPWVAKVVRVSKHPPARLTVDLEYRQPVAWVEVAGAKPGDEGGVIPVDRQASVLPSRDFTQEDLGNYPRISIPNVRPYGLAGTAWGDSRVVGAARIAAALPRNWKSLRLYRIQLAADTELARTQAEPVYELETVARHRIVWGNAPGMESPDEPPLAVKIDRLLQLAESVESLDQIPQSGVDLRDASTFPTARTALRHQPQSPMARPGSDSS